MDINVKVKSNLGVRAFYLFFIISSLQLGVGIMGAPRIIFMEARQDSWISIIIATIYIIIVIFVMYLILKQYENADIFGIQVDIFGTWLGKMLGTVYIIYFAATLLSVLITYTEVVKIFIFPELSPFVMGLLLILLITYSVLGGLRIIIGISFLFFLLTHWLLFLLIEPALEIDITHFQPAFQASFTELLKGAKATNYTFIGFEILFFVYPFIENKEKVKLPVFLAVFWTGLLVLITTVIAIGFYSPDQLERREWSVLNLFKVQSFSFIERLDYVVVAEWMMVITPNMILLMWGVTYGMKRLYKVPQKTTLYIVSFFLLVGCTFIDQHFQIQKVINGVAQFGFWIAYVYPFLLLPLILLKKRRRKRRGDENSA
ncbi:spore gernimation protein [Virgibacillus profundi]|uniref:Spore gernimation protein n=1 Tax=Virgibacillus profundi TaxID=2024555 RepID=A0A2A2IFF9_9BACI|nr:GerAB/ArcD/ProY family transporter [Virgibacillus profundi]PAV29813.1 spore gernimation protein [Virgibacillus profundi]PXY53984.1 spore gernimation protein [Virgibacillus profundi]